MHRVCEQEEESSRSANAGYAIITMLVTVIFGVILGMVMATQHALPGLDAKIVGMIPTDVDNFFGDLKEKISGIVNRRAEEPQIPEESEIISTGLASLGTIHYSPQADSTQMIFNLKDLELINTGRLRSPDRVYVDFQNPRWEQDSFKGILTLKALDIDGDLVSRVRIKKRESGVMRIVLDLTQCCDFTYNFPQQSPSRLIVHLQPV